MAKVSVIVPAYNCEKTLSQCLGNLVHQTLSDIEIIVINDASTDSTWDIMTRCEMQFSDKVMIVNSVENRGAGGARNIGLMYATGEYIGFVDSDDIVAVDMFEKLYNCATEGNYDIVDCGYYNEEEKTAIVHASDELTGDMNGEKISELIVSGGYLWSHLFRRELILDSGIVFRENVILEDCEYLMYMFTNAKRVGNVKEILYNYRYFEKSASKYINAEKYYINATAAIDAIYERMSSLKMYEEIKMAVEYAIIQLASYTVNMSLIYGKREKGFDTKKRIESVCDKVRRYVENPVMENKYVQNKIKKDDLEILMKYI